MIRFEGESFGGVERVGKENEDIENEDTFPGISNVTSHFDLRVKDLREEIIGQDQIIISPPAFAAFPDALDRAKTQRRIVNTDFTATGRALASIENFVARLCSRGMATHTRSAPPQLGSLPISGTRHAK